MVTFHCNYRCCFHRCASANDLALLSPCGEGWSPSQVTAQVTGRRMASRGHPGGGATAVTVSVSVFSVCKQFWLLSHPPSLVLPYQYFCIFVCLCARVCVRAHLRPPARLLPSALSLVTTVLQVTRPKLTLTEIKPNTTQNNSEWCQTI